MGPMQSMLPHQLRPQHMLWLCWWDKCSSFKVSPRKRSELAFNQVQFSSQCKHNIHFLDWVEQGTFFHLLK